MSIVAGKTCTRPCGCRCCTDNATLADVSRTRTRKHITAIPITASPHSVHAVAHNRARWSATPTTPTALSALPAPSQLQTTRAPTQHCLSRRLSPASYFSLSSFNGMYIFCDKAHFLSCPSSNELNRKVTGYRICLWTDNSLKVLTETAHHFLSRVDLSVDTLTARTAALEISAVLKISIPSDPSLAALSPRLYSTAGATLQLDVQVLSVWEGESNIQRSKE